MILRQFLYSINFSTHQDLHFMRIFSILTLTLALAACAPIQSAGVLEASEAVIAVKDAPSAGVRGQFVLTVKAIGSTDESTFFNSELDYRDQTNLTVAMSKQMAQEVEKRLNVPLMEFKNRRIVVSGVAKRVQIIFLKNGQPTGKYYYQTHVTVDQPTQLEFVTPAA
jgi:hypothetical protein